MFLPSRAALEYAASTQVFRHFQIASNEINSPKLLVCDRDRQRTQSTNWNLLNNSNLSCFIGLDSDQAKPTTILSGDRTISTNGNMMSGVWQVSSNGPVVWAKGLHQGAGYIGLADGSVLPVNHDALRKQLQAGLLKTNRFAVP